MSTFPRIPADGESRLRVLLLAILLLGLVGGGADLLLLAHYEDVYQVIPLAMIGAAFPAIGWHLWSGSHASIRVLQVVMTLFVAAGLAGVWFHGQSNMEFQHEIDPSLSGTALLLKVLRAKAPPALAPGVMVQLGLLGLAFAYRHPAIRSTKPTSPTSGESS